LTNLKEPTDSLKISESDEAGAKVIGATSLEYVSDHGPKYLIGTERGSIMMSTKKPKNEAVLNFNSSFGLKMGRHLGPIYSIKRNPTYARYFLAVGDWSASVSHILLISNKNLNVS
jgi:dynein intermediate chain 2, axonemal